MSTLWEIAERHFRKRPDKTAAFGKRYTDLTGQTWQLVSQNDLNVPYWAKVNRGTVGKTLYTLSMGESAALRLIGD